MGPGRGKGDSDNPYCGLYPPGALDAATRKPAYAAFQEVCARRLPAPDEGAFDNRTLIRAVTLTAGELGVEPVSYTHLTLPTSDLV